jgi:hypothetical protein
VLTNRFRNPQAPVGIAIDEISTDFITVDYGDSGTHTRQRAVSRYREAVHRVRQFVLMYRLSLAVITKHAHGRPAIFSRLKKPIHTASGSTRIDGAVGDLLQLKLTSFHGLEEG